MSTNTLASKESMSLTRRDHGILKIDRRIFVFGGHSDQRYDVTSAEAYDVSENCWYPLPDMPKKGSGVS